MKILTILLLFTPIYLFSQIDTFQNQLNIDKGNIYEIIENFMENVEEEVEDVEEIIELLASFNQKVNINYLSPEQAFMLLKLSEYQYYQLLLYIEKYGELVTLYELYAIEGWDVEDVEKVLPFVTIGSRKKGNMNFKDVFQHLRHRLLFRFDQILESQAGYDKERSNHYVGSPAHLLLRYQFSNSYFSVGISGEKDAGEEFFKGSQKQGFDFYAFHISIKKISFLQNITFGDYRLNFGQGLVIGNSFANGKGGGVSNIRKFSTGIKPVTPLNESRSFRGFATEIGNAKYKGTIFYGIRTFDGVLETNSTCENSVFSSSLTVNGYHRTKNEIEKKKQLLVRNFGFNFQWNRSNSRLGVTAIYHHFNHPVINSKSISKKYAFAGDSHFNFGTDHQVIGKKTIFFGEIAMSQGNHFAWMEGVLFDPDPRCKFGAIFRYYDKKYIALEGSSFGVVSTNQNETGLFLTAEFLIGRRSEIYLYYDFYQFPWSKFQTDFSSYGSDASARFSTQLSRNCKLGLRYNYLQKEKNISLDYYNGMQILDKHKFRVYITSEIFNIIKLKTQVDYHTSYYPKEEKWNQGVVILQDFEVKIPTCNLKCNLRFAVFDTDTYEERIYTYENDVLYAFSCIPYYGKGCRFYGIIQYKYQFIELQLRYSQTFFADRVAIGSGLTLIEKSSKSDIKAQLYFRF